MGDLRTRDRPSRGCSCHRPVAQGAIRILDRAETLATIAELHERVGFDRPGAIGRPRWMHERFLDDAIGLKKAAHVIVHTNTDGVDDGWAQYSLEWLESSVNHVGGKCTVDDVWGATPAVELALWKFILELDLIDVVHAGERPLDDAVRFGLSSQRHYLSRRRSDEQWLRLIDVDAALSARTYNSSSAVVTVAVSDPLFPANCGTWEISSAGARHSGVTADNADLRPASTACQPPISAAPPGTICGSGCGAPAACRCLADADVLFASRLSLVAAHSSDLGVTCHRDVASAPPLSRHCRSRRATAA